jgi:hypothetical protein
LSSARLLVIFLFISVVNAGVDSVVHPGVGITTNFCVFIFSAADDCPKF